MSLDKNKKVSVKFWKSPGSRVQIQTPDLDQICRGRSVHCPSALVVSAVAAVVDVEFRALSGTSTTRHIMMWTIHLQRLYKDTSSM